MQTRNLIIRVLLFLLAMPVFAQEQTKVTIANINLRVSACIGNNIICTIPRATTLTIDSVNQENPEWLIVKYRGKTGYVFSRYLSTPIKKSSNNASNLSVTSSDVRHYTNSQGEKVQSPTYYSSPPPGATAECWDGTYSFSRSRRGTCSHHGGVKRWL